jgi:vacuolar-type H+-ATPase subunit E/Vma4
LCSIRGRAKASAQRVVTAKPRNLEAQQQALRKELRELDAESEARRRMLRLLSATEQQLAGPAQEIPREDGPELSVKARVEVRGGATLASAVAL